MTKTSIIIYLDVDLDPENGITELFPIKVLENEPKIKVTDYYFYPEVEDSDD